jgi:ribose transport system permease protein
VTTAGALGTVGEAEHTDVEVELPDAAPPTRTLAERAVNVLLDYGIYVALAVEIIVFAVLSPFFLSVDNFLNIAQAASVLGIVAAAFFVGLVGGRIDLSLAAIVALTTVVMARVVTSGHPLWLALFVAFGAAIAVAMLNGIIAITFGVNPLVTSLAAMTFVSGIALVIAQGQTRAILSPWFQEVIFRRPLGIPTPVYVLAVVYALLAVMMYTTKIGWHIYAVGGNEIAAERAAIKTKRVYWFMYLLTSALAWLAGVITAGRAGAGSPALGPDVFNVMTAVLLGGIGFAGGGGRIERTLVGVLFIAVLENGLVLLDVPSFYGNLIRGAALVLAVVLSSIRDRRMRR